MAGKEIRKKREEDRSKREDAGYSLLLDLADALKRHEETMPQLPEMLNGLAEVCQLLAKEADESRKGDERMRPEEQLKSMMKELEEKSERLVTLQSTLDEKGKQIIAMEKERERLATLQSTLDKKGEQIIAMEKERERYREENQKLKNESVESKEKCKEKLKDKKEKISSFENQLEIKERELADEKKERGREQQLAQQRILSIDNELEIKERELADEKKERGKEQHLAQQRISFSESELKKKQKEQEDVKREHEKQEKVLQRKMNCLDRDLREAKRKIGYHEATIKQKSTTIQRLEGSRDSMGKPKKVDKEKMYLEERIKDLESELEIIKAEKDQNERQMSDEFKEKLEETERKLENGFQVKEQDLVKRLELKDVAIKDLESELEIIKTEKEQKERQMSDALNEKEEIQRKLEKDFQLKEELARRLELKDETIRKLENDLQGKEDKFRKKLLQIDEDVTRNEEVYESFLSEKAKETNEMKERNAKLESDLKHMKDDHENKKIQLKKKIEEKDTLIAQITTELNKKEIDHEEEKKQLLRREDEAQQRITQLETELSKNEIDHEEEKKELLRREDEAQQRMTDHEDHRKNDFPNDTEMMNSGYHARIAELETKLTAMKDEHEKEKLQLQKEIEERGNLKLTQMKDYHEKEILQLQKQIEQRNKPCDRLIQERDALKVKVEYYANRLASLSEKRVKQDQRKVEDTLALNRQSELEKDINDFFDNERIDACELLQKKYGSEEENDIHIYYPRLACMILETAYEQTVDARKAVVDVFEKFSEWMIVHASESGQQFDRVIKDGRCISWAFRVDVPVGKKETEHSVDVDGLMLSLKESAHHANLDCFVQDVEYRVFQKWTKWVMVEKSCGLTPSYNVLQLDLRGYTQACIRLTWRMATQVPPMSLKYQSSILDNCDKRLGYHCSQEMFATGQGPDEEIACYLRPGLYDGGGRLIRQGEVLCKVKKQT